MSKYPTNGKTAKLFSGNLRDYPEGTHFKTANGMEIELEYLGDPSTCKVLTYLPGVERPQGKRVGYWRMDGTKQYAHDWPPDSHIVWVL